MRDNLATGIIFVKAAQKYSVVVAPHLNHLIERGQLMEQKMFF